MISKPRLSAFEVIAAELIASHTLDLPIPANATIDVKLPADPHRTPFNVKVIGSTTGLLNRNTL